jgi:hypothetical protein
MMVIVLVVSFINIDGITKMGHRYISYINEHGFPDGHYVESMRVILGDYTTILAVLCTLMPIFELYSFKSRRNLDTLFTLPISRVKTLFAHLLNGWIHIMIAFTAEAAIIFVALRQEKYLVHESYLFGYYFALLAVGLAAYLFFAFVFSQGNTIIDGVVFMGGWICAFAMPLWIANDINRKIEYAGRDTVNRWLSRAEDYGLVYHPFDSITTAFMDLMSIGYNNKIESYKIIGATFWFIIGIICLVLLYFTFKKQRVEKVEDISTSPIGYKFLIPFYVISFMLVEYDPLMVVICVIGMLVTYIIYRRTFRIKKWDIIMIGITIFVGIGVGIADYVIESTHTAEAAAQLCGNVFQHINL